MSTATATAGREIVVRCPAYHPGQIRLKEKADTNKVTIAFVGRRWGKTYFGAKYAFEFLTGEAKPGEHVGWVAPSFDLSMISWYEFHDKFGPAIKESNKTERWVQLHGTPRMFWRSADDPKSLRGRGFKKLLLDEARWISDKAYYDALQGTLADMDGDIIAFSSPAGRHGWMYEEFCRAQSGEPGYAWLNLPSWDNPNPRIRKFVDFRRKKMPGAVFAQEFGAEILEDSSALFKGLAECIGGSPQPPIERHSYIVGIDVAKEQAWTVVWVFDITNAPYQLVYLDRFHHIDWPEQYRRAKRTCDVYNHAQAVVDETGVGSAVVSGMREIGMSVHGFTFTGDRNNISGTRKELLDEFSIAIAEHRVQFPREGSMPVDEDPYVIAIEELGSMMIDMDENGRTIYRSRGEFCDCVMAGALAYHGAPKLGASGVTIGRLSDQETAEADDESAIGMLRKEF